MAHDGDLYCTRFHRRGWLRAEVHGVLDPLMISLMFCCTWLSAVSLFMSSYLREDEGEGGLAAL